MDQMNVSITDQLAGYVRKRVKSGRYNNASEVVREALRRMEGEDQRALRLAKPTAEDLLTDLTEQQLDGIRRRVRASIEGIEAIYWFQGLRWGQDGLNSLSVFLADARSDFQRAKSR
jgi:putative addiction module CopG family antidote